jgi:hypothetical protein
LSSCWASVIFLTPSLVERPCSDFVRVAVSF